MSLPGEALGAGGKGPPTLGAGDPGVDGVPPGDAEAAPVDDGDDDDDDEPSGTWDCVRGREFAGDCESAFC